MNGRERVDCLKLLSSNVLSRARLNISSRLFHEDMRNAITQRNYDALLTLALVGNFGVQGTRARTEARILTFHSSRRKKCFAL